MPAENTHNEQHAVAACKLCKVALSPVILYTATWCDRCEAANLYTISMKLDRDRDNWLAEFWDANQTKMLTAKRTFANTCALFTLVARAYDPGGPLDALAHTIRTSRPGTVQFRITAEQYERLCRVPAPAKAAIHEVAR